MDERNRSKKNSREPANWTHIRPVLRVFIGVWGEFEKCVPKNLRPVGVFVSRNQSLNANFSVAVEKWLAFIEGRCDWVG